MKKTEESDKTNGQAFLPLLTESGIRPSVQRVAIFKWLMDNRIHPTADQVYHAISAEYPTLSKTTVYNTLHLFAEKNLVQEIKIENNEVRYDANTNEHYHFKCNRCGKIYDLYIKKFNRLVENQLPPNFTIDHIESNLWGTCGECKGK